MVVVSNEYKSAVSQLFRRFSSQITFEDQTITTENIKSMDITESVNDSENLTVGSCCMSTLSLTLYDYSDSLLEKTISPYIGLYTGSNEPEYIPMGVFVVSESKRNDTHTVSVTAKDRMSLFDAECEVFTSGGVITLTAGNNSATLSVETSTLLDWIQAICGIVSVPLANTRFPNAEFVPGLTFAGIMQLRTILFYISQAAGCFARFNRSGELEIAWYKPSDKTMSGVNYSDFTVWENEMPPIDKVIIRAEEGSVPTEQGEGSNAYEIIGNPLLYTNPGYAISGIYESISGFGYSPYQIYGQDDPAIQAGDIITVTNTSGKVVTCPVMTHRISYSGGVSGELKATNTLQQAQTSVSDKIKILNRRTNQLEIDDEVTRSTISKIQTDVEARATVEQVSQIEQTVAGIDAKTSIRGGYNLLHGTAAFDLENWDTSGTVGILRDNPLVYNTGTRGAFVLTEEAFLSQMFYTIPGEEYCFMFRYRTAGATYVPASAVIAETEISLPLSEDWRVVNGSFTATGTQNAIVITSTSGTLYVADVIVMYGTEVTAWQQGQNEIITSGYRYTNGRMIIYGTEEDPLQTEITNSAVTVRDENTNEIKWHVSVGGVELDKTVVRERIEIQPKDTAEKAFAILPQGDGHVYFVIND